MPVLNMRGVEGHQLFHLFWGILDDTTGIYSTPSDRLAFGTEQVLDCLQLPVFCAFLEPPQVVSNKMSCRLTVSKTDRNMTRRNGSPILAPRALHENNPLRITPPGKLVR